MNIVNTVDKVYRNIVWFFLMVMNVIFIFFTTIFGMRDTPSTQYRLPRNNGSKNNFQMKSNLYAIGGRPPPNIRGINHNNQELKGCMGGG